MIGDEHPKKNPVGHPTKYDDFYHAEARKRKKVSRLNKRLGTEEGHSLQ